MARLSLGGRFQSGASSSSSAPDSGTTKPPQPKRRRFFSAVNLPPLPIAHAPTPPRAVASTRVLAALQADERAVAAAKTFVKEKMGDDKWDVIDKKRVTRGASSTAALANGAPPTKRRAGDSGTSTSVSASASASAFASASPSASASTFPSAPESLARSSLSASPAPSAMASASASASASPAPNSEPSPAPAPVTSAPAAKPAKRAPSPLRKRVIKAQSKRVALGTTTIAQRIKAKGAQLARKATLRPTAPPAAPAAPVAGPSKSKAEETPEHERKRDREPSPDAYEPNPGKRKQFLESGLYCQDEEPSQDRMLVNRVLDSREPPKKRGPGRPRKSDTASVAGGSNEMSPIPRPEGEPVSFPPLPLEYHFNVFFGDEEREFLLPYNIMWESETGALDGKKRPPFYQKLRTNQFIERAKYPAYEDRAVCNCDPSYGCGDNCINKIMSYLCGSQCPCGENCRNKSLARRKGKATKVVFTGPRGFGLVAADDIKEGEFVADYRGEIIHINTFIERIGTIYQKKRDFYALAYDRDEVIDAGLRGNDTRFINHGCDPNLEVRKYATLGDGFEEYEVGVWARRDIKAGEELFYNYNFDSFAVTVQADHEREKCMCGAANCAGFLGRKQGEKSAKELAADKAAKAAKDASTTKRKRVSTGTSIPLPANAAVAQAPLRGRPRASLPVKLPSEAEPDPAPAPRPIGRPRKVPAPIVPPASSAWPSWSATAGTAGPSRKTATATPVTDAANTATTATTVTTTPTATTATPATAVPTTGTTDPTASPETPLKRKRGRPPKPKPLGVVPGVKRPRGRPRIHPVPDPALKRPRGRPRKNAPISYAEVDTDSDVDSPRVKKEKELQTSPLASASASTSASAQVTPQTGPKRRGRPPKVRPAPYEIPYDTPEPAKATAAIPVAGVEAEAKPAPEAKDATLNAAASSSRLRAAGDVIAAAGAAAQSVNKTVNSLKLKFTVPPPSAGPEPASPATPSVHRATPKQVEKAKRNGAPAGYAFVSAPATPTPATATAHSTPAASGSGSSLNVETTDLGTPESARQTPKQAEKAKRNGAPAGWAYVVDGAQKATSAGPTPPSDRAARLAARRN